MLSWGHEEASNDFEIFHGCAKSLLQYLYNVFKHQSSLPREALAMIRYHSFYPWHREDWKELIGIL